MKKSRSPSRKPHPQQTSPFVLTVVLMIHDAAVSQLGLAALADSTDLQTMAGL